LSKESRNIIVRTYLVPTEILATKYYFSRKWITKHFKKNSLASLTTAAV